MSEQPRQTGAYDSSSLSLRAERVVEEARRPSAQELADARKLLEQLLAPCEGADAHSWRKCKRCAAVHGIEMRFSLSMRLLRALLASQEAAPCPDYKPAWDEINRVFDDAAVLLAKEPRSYLGWNWVHALVDALKRRQEGSPR